MADLIGHSSGCLPSQIEPVARQYVKVTPGSFYQIKGNSLPEQIS